MLIYENGNAKVYQVASVDGRRGYLVVVPGYPDYRTFRKNRAILFAAKKG